MLLWKKRATALCPRCLLEVEDATHVWQCQDPRALNVWTQAIANLETWMQKQRTEPGIRVICAKLLWQSGSTEEIQVGTFTLFRRWFRNRMRSDGNPFWKALSVGWSEVQHRYYEFLDSRRTGLRWLTALIQKLWDVAWDMWDHRNRALQPGTFGRTRPTDSDYR
jgi:hypothetical protein